MIRNKQEILIIYNVSVTRYAGGLQKRWDAMKFVVGCDLEQFRRHKNNVC
jgi:hypothetical protein